LPIDHNDPARFEHAEARVYCPPAVPGDARDLFFPSPPRNKFAVGRRIPTTAGEVRFLFATGMFRPAPAL